MTPSPDLFPVPLIHVSETDSTNNYLQTLCSQQQIEEFTTVIADFQSLGKGQRGNSWESENGKNLLFSMVLFPKFLEARHQFLISQIISLAIKEALDVYTSDISIKWPNDIYWKDKKICGILIENDWMGSHVSQTIAGIGININQRTFHSSAPNPVSIWQITGKDYDRRNVLANLIEHIKSYYELLQQKQTEIIASRYVQSLFHKEGFHLYKDSEGEFMAEINRVEPDGRFILKDRSGRERSYLFKEIEYIIRH